MTDVHVIPADEPLLHANDENCSCDPNVQLELQDDGTTAWVFHHHPLNLEEAS